MSIRVATADKIDGQVLQFLLENNHVHYADEEELRDPAMNALVLVDDDEVIVACAYMIVQRGQYRDLEVIAANTKPIKKGKWLLPLLHAFEKIAESQGCRAVLVPVGRPALAKALEQIGYGPFATMFARFVS